MPYNCNITKIIKIIIGLITSAKVGRLQRQELGGAADHALFG
jgi:hypothetical protein